MNKKTVKISTYITFLSLSILIGSMLLTLFVGAVLIHTKIFVGKSHFHVFVLFSIFNLFVVTSLYRFFTRKLMRIISEMTQASEEMAKGNFETRLPEDYRIMEFQTVAKSFNSMAKQLSQTEILSNDFIRNISHEFKTPLAAIKGYSQLIQEEKITLEKKNLYAQKIIHNTRRLSLLTTSILELSQLEHREILTQKEKFSLDEQIREVILMFEPIWEKKNLTLDIDIASMDYYGNQELLSGIWQNLMSNAIKFSKPKGNIYIGLKKGREELIFTITDDGIGIKEEDQGRIFEKFFQGDTFSMDQGNGLGLALVKRIVDLYHGKILCYSKENKGTSFIVTLPLS